MKIFGKDKEYREEGARAGAFEKPKKKKKPSKFSKFVRGFEKRVVLRKRTRPKRRGAGSVGLIRAGFPTSRSYGRSGRPRGRPKGTFKYYIPGVGPASVFQYRKWLAKKRAMERLKGIQQAPQEYQQEYYPPQQAMAQPPVQRAPVGNILNAPNFMKGELTNVGDKGMISDNSVPDVDTLNKPVANPRGDYFVDVDPMSGRPMLRRRIRERWLS